MPDGFHDVVFPEQIAYGSSGGPEFKTAIVETASGFEQRSKQWARPRHRWNVASGVKSRLEMRQLLSFFWARNGKLYGFRYKDWSDYVFQPTDTLLSVDATHYQMVRRYQSGGVEVVRKITKPVLGTIVLASPTSHTIDYDTGIISFTGSPSGALTLTGEFHVPARFDTDVMDINIEAFDVREWSSIMVVELKDA